MPSDLGDGGLFEVEPGMEAGSIPASLKRPVDKTFRAFTPDQGLLLPPSLDDWLPEGHLARFVAELVDEHLDLSRIRAGYTEGRGAPPYDPRLMVRVLIYGYTTGVRSSRKLEAARTDVVAFRWLAGGQAPDYRAIARFRHRHLAALGHLFVQALALCQAAGMVKLGRVALDGTKLRANASRRKAMSYARMSAKEKILAEEVSALLADAEGLDRAEDAAFGKDARGDELPEELRRRDTRLAKIRAAKKALEAQAGARAKAKAAAAPSSLNQPSQDQGAGEQSQATPGQEASEANPGIPLTPPLMPPPPMQPPPVQPPSGGSQGSADAPGGVGESGPATEGAGGAAGAAEAIPVVPVWPSPTSVRELDPMALIEV